MSDIVIVKPEKCIGCNACVRVCPASEANITRMLDNGKFITTVNSSRCIACGECIKSCKYGARDYIDDTEACMAAISEESVIILATPALKATYPNQWKSILDWFKKKNCLVYDVSFGADICSWAHLKALEFDKLGNVISQPCAAVVNYIEMYQPKLLQNISPVHSPACCSAIYITKYQRRTQKIALLSSCLAEKRAMEETGLIQFNVTFKKLMEYFDKNDIRIQTTDYADTDYPFDDIQGLMGSIFSRPGGLRDNLLARNPNISVMNYEGVQNVYKELDAYIDVSPAKQPKILDVSSCEYGCNSGAGVGKKFSGFDLMSQMQRIEFDIRSKVGAKNAFRGGIDEKLYKKFDNELELSDFMRVYKPAIAAPDPNIDEMNTAFEKMGKTTSETRSVDCKACGYDSCRQMAIAICREQNVPANCMFYAKSVLLSGGNSAYADNIKIERIANECKILSEKLSLDINEIVSNMDLINESTNKLKERANVTNELLRNVVAFCNKNPEMNKATVDQLIRILEATITAFSTVDEYVGTTDKHSVEIKDGMAKIAKIISGLNSTLFTNN